MMLSPFLSVPLAYVGVIMIWSTTPLAIKWSNQAAGFLFGVSSRMLLGFLICCSLLWVLRQSLVWDKAARRVYLTASMGIYGSMMVTYWGAQFIPSGLISVLFGLSPITTSLLAIVMLQERHFNLTKWVGMLLGVIGLGIIFQTELTTSADGWKGLVAILLAMLLHCLSAVLIKRLRVHHLSPLMMTTGGLLYALPLYGLTGVVVGLEFPHSLDLKPLLSIFYLGLFGSVVGFMLYFYLLKRLDTGRVALITLITPLTALSLGQVLNGEVVAVSVWVGAVVVLLGLSLYQWGDVGLRKEMVEKG